MRAIRTHSRDFAALLGLVAVALLAAGYIVIHQYARGTIPLLEQPPFKIKADFSNAQAVVPGQGETVRAAGVQVGKVGDVQTQGGTAIVTLAIDPKWKKKLDVRSDATALLRPRTGLKDMFVELDPGTGGRRLHDGDTIPVANTAPDVNPDEILSALDTDTRAYLQLLIGGLGKGFNGNGTSLNAVFKRLGPTQRDLGRVAGAVAQRRAALERLVHNYGRLTNTLADKDGEITRLVRSANAVFGSFAAANQQISQSVALLPGTLDQTKATLQNVNSFSRVAGPALESLRPAVRELNVANHRVLPFVREAYPLTRNKIRPFVRAARPYVRDVKPAALNLATAAPDLTSSFHELNRFFDIAAYNPRGREPVTGNTAQDRRRDEGYLFWLGWTAHLTTSLFSTSDAQGPFRRIVAGMTCSSVRALIHQTPVAEPLIGLTNVLADPALCGSNSAVPPAAAGAAAKRGRGSR